MSGHASTERYIPVQQSSYRCFHSNRRANVSTQKYHSSQLSLRSLVQRSSARVAGAASTNPNPSRSYPHRCKLPGRTGPVTGQRTGCGRRASPEKSVWTYSYSIHEQLIERASFEPALPSDCQRWARLRRYDFPGSGE